MTRLEFEYEIPLGEAIELLNLCETPIIEKTRYEVRLHDKIWEIDEFEGLNQGLIIAEVELKNENEKVTLPDWIGEEVTGDAKYYNTSLSQKPLGDW